MTRLLLIIAIVFSVTLAARAQQPTVIPCPSIKIESRQGVTQTVESIQFVARLEANGWNGPFQYHWSVSWSDPVTRERVNARFEGQGTSAIKVLEPKTGVLAKLEVNGFPAGCANTAAEVVHWDRVPQAIKLAEFTLTSSSIDTATAKKIAAEMDKEPDSQLFVLWGQIKGTPQVQLQRHLRDIFWSLSDRGLDRERITFQTVIPGRDLVQFWRVPPGAAPPKCSECELPGEAAKMLECPLIIVSGPAGVTKPGDPMIFTLSGSLLPPQADLKWEVEGGEVGKQSIDGIETSWKIGRNVTATLHVTGLPKGCPSSFSETAGVAH
jgi:hypothetical protein